MLFHWQQNSNSTKHEYGLSAACEEGKDAASAMITMLSLIKKAKSVMLLSAACEEGKDAASADDERIISDNKCKRCEGKPASTDDECGMLDNKIFFVLIYGCSIRSFKKRQRYSFPKADLIGKPIPPYLQKHSAAVNINDGFETSGRTQERSAWGLEVVYAVSATFQRYLEKKRVNLNHDQIKTS
ncbi:Uncharacterized protein Rs2_03987 [Raphanus sativus]|nr:Uncharacterized protein Rs2_03987 [Raphanus sativus]